jgi:16S rRNA processing protein RimM
MAWDDMVLVGRIARTHGHRGQVIVDPATDFPEERFAAGAMLHTMRDGLAGTVRVAAMRMHQGRPVLTIEGVDTMDAAETLAGVELRVPESALAPLPDGTFYEHDLIGCALVTTDGREVGRVRTLEGGGGMIRLIAGAGRDEIQVPLVHEICVAIDIAGKRIVIDPPEGLLDVNA